MGWLKVVQSWHHRGPTVAKEESKQDKMRSTQEPAFYAWAIPYDSIECGRLGRSTALEEDPQSERPGQSGRRVETRVIESSQPFSNFSFLIRR